MQLFLIFCFIAVALAEPDCPANSHYDKCGTACPVTCENHLNPPKFCILVCKAGCHCDEGYVKNKNGECVLPEDCNSNAVCGENQEYQTCGTACPLTCDNYDNPPKICNAMCLIGCQCKKGYVRTKDGQCVLPENCPNRAAAVCGENQEYQTCGTACPLTCDNYNNPPKICNAMCVIGCQCKKSFVRTNDGQCVRSENCPNSSDLDGGFPCLLKPDTGMCRGSFPKFYYDAKAGRCQKFIYGGCQGNINRFDTEEECLNECGGFMVHDAKSPVCDQPIKRGICLAFLHRYAYDKTTGDCTKFVYGGCGANGNNFESLEECRKKCVE